MNSVQGLSVQRGEARNGELMHVKEKDSKQSL